MPEIKMIGEHKIEMIFKNSHACAFWIKQIRRMFDTQDFDDIVFETWTKPEERKYA